MRGIYKITNKVNGKCYIGRSKNVFTRLESHFRQLRANGHSKEFQDDFNRDGLDGFSFEILYTGTLTALIEREVHFIELFDSFNNGYNSQDESKIFKDVFTVEKKEEYLKKALTITDGSESPNIRHFDEETLDIMLPIFDNNIELLRASNEILIIPNKFEEFRKVPFIYLNKDLD